MTRYRAGGAVADYTIITAGDTVTVGAVTGETSVVVGAVDCTWWNSEVGGSQYTDLLDSTGAAVTSVLSSDTTDGRGLGQIPPIQYPDNVTAAWVSGGGGPRTLMLADTGETAVATAVALDAHQAQPNGHNTGAADLVDVVVPAPEDRTLGDVLGVIDTGGTLGLLTPSQVAGAVLLAPPTGGGYVGNVADPPPVGQNEPWLQMRQPYSAADSNPDAIQLFSTHSDGITPIKTSWKNGNNEDRGAPSTPTRVAGRWFEAYEARGGPSTSRFFELSTNPTIAASREPLFGAYGTGHATQPGWMVATRVLAGLQGVRAGGSFNSLSAVNFRGRSGTAGAPTTGTWVTGDIVIDTTGTVHLCTAGGTPGTWVGAPAPTAFIALTPGASMGHGSKQAASRLERGGDAVRLRGFLTASGSVAAGAVVATIPTTGHRPLAPVTTIARYTGGGTKTDIATNGEIVLGNSLTAGQSVWLDCVTYDLLA